MFWLNDCAKSILEKIDDPQERTLLDWYCEEIFNLISNTKEWGKISNNKSIQPYVKNILKARPDGSA